MLMKHQHEHKPPPPNTMAFTSTSSVGILSLVLSFLILSVPAFAAPPQWQQSTAMVSSPLGAAQVVNTCAFDVHSNIVHAPRPGAEGPPEEIYTVIPAGRESSHPFLHDPGTCILG